jgi:hypothetical protein
MNVSLPVIDYTVGTIFQNYSLQWARKVYAAAAEK